MNDIVLEKCERLVNNRSAVHKKFVFENSLMSLVAGLIFNSADKEADIDKMEECKKILKEKKSFGSELRLTTELAVISKMALAENPESYLADLTEIYETIRDGKLLENSYQVLSAVLICDLGLQKECADIVAKAKEIMKKMEKDHPILTKKDDLSYMILLAISYKSVDDIINDINEGYTYIKKAYKAKATSDSVQGLCEVLAITYGDMKAKCDKVMRIFNTFTERKTEYGTEQEFAALGVLVDIDIEPGTLVDEIIEVSEYLKDKSGFSDNSMGAKKRLMYSAMLIADVYGSNSDIMSNSVLSNTISIITAQRISLMISIITTALQMIPAAED